MINKSIYSTKQLALICLTGALGFSFQSCDKFPYGGNGDSDGTPKPQKNDQNNSGSGNSATCNGKTVNFANLKQGRQSGMEKSQNKVIKTQQAYKNLWQKMGLRASRPNVDFSQHFVLATFQGKKASSGFKIRVSGLCVTGQSLSVNVTKTRPSSGCPVKSVFTRPFQLVKVSRDAVKSKLNQLQVNFQSQITKQCNSKDGSGTSGNANFSTILKGTGSGVDKRQNKVIRNQSQLKNVWQSIHSGKVNAPSLPKVDFNKEMVIGIFYGQKPTGGYGVSIQNIRKNANQLSVQADLINPKDGCQVTMALTNPFHLVRVPVTASNVNFDLNKVTKPCR